MQEKLFIKNMNESKLRTLITEYLQQAKLMQLATVSNGNPWVCSVWYGFDDDLNIYFFSATNRRHSLEISNDNRVAGAMALPQTPQDQPRGLQFEGKAKRLTDEADITHARSTYEGRIFDAETINKFMAHQERPHSFYRIVPSKFVLFDAVNFPENSRQEYKL